MGEGRVVDLYQARNEEQRMSERETDATSAERSFRIAREAQTQSDRALGPEHEHSYEHVIDALCSAAGRIVNVSFSAVGEPVLTEYP
jgi:hypothetical protein